MNNKLKHYFGREGHSVVSLYHKAGKEYPLTLQTMLWHLAQLQHRLQQRPETRVVIAVKHNYLFTVALLAAFLSKKDCLLPPHTQEDLLLDLSQQAFVFTDEQLHTTAESLCSLVFRPADDFFLDCGDPDPLAGSGSEEEQAQQIAQVQHALQQLDPDQLKLFLFTSGSTGKRKTVEKSLSALLNEAELTSACFGPVLSDTVLLSSVYPFHMYGLSFTVMLPLALQLVTRCDLIHYSEQLSTLPLERHYSFISSPAFLKRLDPQLTYPQLSFVLSAGGPLPMNCLPLLQQGLHCSPHEIYGSTETGVIAWRAPTAQDQAFQLFDGVELSPEGEDYRVSAPHLKAPVLLDDRIVLAGRQLHLMGRKDDIVKIEEKRLSLMALENELRTLPHISDVAVTVITKGQRSLLAALLVLDHDEDPRLLKERCNKALSARFDSVACLRRLKCVPQIPYNHMGKRVKTAITALLEN